MHPKLTFRLRDGVAAAHIRWGGRAPVYLLLLSSAPYLLVSSNLIPWKVPHVYNISKVVQIKKAENNCLAILRKAEFEEKSSLLPHPLSDWGSCWHCHQTKRDQILQVFTAQSAVLGRAVSASSRSLLEMQTLSSLPRPPVLARAAMTKFHRLVA